VLTRPEAVEAFGRSAGDAAKTRVEARKRIMIPPEPRRPM
jgi:hypothetical protein